MTERPPMNGLEYIELLLAGVLEGHMPHAPRWHYISTGELADLEIALLEVQALRRANHGGAKAG